MLQVAGRGYAELLRNPNSRSTVTYIRLPSFVTKTFVFDTSAEFAACCASAIDLTDEEYLKELESVPSY
jgi:hypothetical protein